QADIGVAMGAAGSPAAIETADIALMADKLPRLPYALGLAQRTVRTMRVNIAIALATVAILLVGVLLGGVTMSIGMLVHEASVLLVIAIAMLLLRPTLKEGKDQAEVSTADAAKEALSA
ncbi:cation-transporting P-type ATPase, partial [Corynebacterium hylobatis]